MNAAIYGDTFREFIFNDLLISRNETLPDKELVNWNLYQYGSCTLFVIAGCIVVCPLLQKRNYKSKQRQKILVVDGLSLIFCLIRSISLLFAFRQGNVATACLLFFWSLGTAFLITTLIVFLFILWSTTKLQPMLWHMKNTLVIALVVAVNLILVTCKELAFSFSFSKTICSLMSNLLLSASLINGTCFLVVGICFCGTFKKMTRNRRPSIRLVKDSNKRKNIRTKVVHTDVENFNTMVRKLRLIALLTFIMFGFNFYTNIKLIMSLNSPGKYHFNDIEIFCIEVSIRIMEILIVILIFCVGFLSPQHKEAAKQWIRRLSQSRSHEELSIKRTYSVDSGRETASDGKGRSGTLEACFSECNNEGASVLLPNHESKSYDCVSNDIIVSPSAKQDTNYLMVPNSLP